LFEAPGDGKRLPVSVDVAKAAVAGVDVQVILDGVHREFVLNDAEQTVLEAAGQQGLELPFSCAGGMCATCRCKIVEGMAEMDRNFSLDDWELEAGFVLACQLRPTSRSLKLDFDAA
ncbi:MAG: 2Fe-2S iron-sulfur cluster binding domain-containing protein, partial [Pseudomonadota bacterium]